MSGAGDPVRHALLQGPALAGALVDPAPPSLMAPLVGATLTPAQAAGLDLILEGFLLHHGEPRYLMLADPGRRVLAGDYCFAQGLVRVAAAGDLEIIEALADLVAVSAALVAEGRREDLAPLWRATAGAVAGDGGAEGSLRFRTAKRALREGDGGPMRELASGLAPAPGLDAALPA